MEIRNKSEFNVDEMTTETISGTKLSKTRLLFLVIFTGVVLCLGVIAIINSIRKDGDLVVTIVLSILFLIVFLIALFIFLFSKKIIRKNYVKAYGDKGISYDYTFHVNRVDISVKTYKNKDSGTIYFERLKKVVETDSLLKLYVDKQTFYMVKKNNFKSFEFPKVKQSLIESKVKYKEKMASVNNEGED